MHTGPYTAVRWIERTPVPAGRMAAGVWKRASAEALRSLRHRAVGLHPSVVASRPGPTGGVLPHGAVEMRVSTSPSIRSGLQRIAPPNMPSADFCAVVRSPRGSLSSELGTRRRPPGVSSVAFRAQLPDLRFASLMDMDFAVSGPLVRRSRLVPGSCSSTRTFAPRFLQTPPRGDSPCALLTLHLHQVG